MVNRPFLALLCAALLCPTARAADLKVALTERAHWPFALSTPEAFDTASRAELALFIEALAASDARKPGPGSAATVAQWKERMRQVLVENFASARATCTPGALLCEGPVPENWDALVTAAHEGLQRLPAPLRAWSAEHRAFHQTYLAEQLRLAGLFPQVSSEILPLEVSERTGLELPDRHFLLTFDDGPTPPGGETDALTALVRAEGLHAAFFLLGNHYEERREATSAGQLRALYAGMCVGSHGHEHRSLVTAPDVKAKLEAFHARLAQTLPEGQPRVTLFRPPYGQRNRALLDLIAREGMTDTLWNIDSQDWREGVTGAPDAGRVVTLMLLWRRGTILFHDVHPKAHEALPRIWRETRGSGVVWVDCRELP